MHAQPVDPFHQRLERMRREYGAWLEGELAHLAAAAGEALRSEGMDAWQGLRDRLHKIAGGAATFGFTRVGDICRACERRLDEAFERDTAAYLGEVAGLIGDLPQRLATEERDAQPAAADLRPAPGDEDGERLIYILEDDEVMAAQLGQILESFHYGARVFSCGDALIEACRAQRPDALIVDLHDGGRADGGGLAVAEAVQRELGSVLPVFASVRSPDFDVQLRAVRAGIAGFLPRPLEPIRVAGLLENHLHSPHAAPMRVLMVDDDRAMLTYYQLVLENAGLTVYTLDDPAQTLVALERFNPDVLVLDVRMPECGGPELAQIVRYHARWLQMPIVYLSAIEDAGEQLATMNNAGDDFLVKPIAAETLVASVLARVRRARELAAALARDGLTGLLKHADIKERLASSLAQSQRQGQPLSIAMLDIDHFKQVNDTHGHPTGDAVIRALANLLRRRLRASDLIGRYGGEEFLAVLPGCDATQAMNILNELRESFALFSFRGQEGDFSCTLSAGLCEAQPTANTDTLIAGADARLYEAKRGGRNQVVGTAG